MTIKVALEHRTSYSFDRPTKIYPHVVRLRPAPHSRTPIEAYSLKVEPGEHFLNWQQDAFSNYLARLVFPEPSTTLSITVSLVADLTAINPFDFFIEDWAEHYGFEYPEELRRDLEIFLRPVGVTEGEFAGAPVHPEVAAFAARHKPIGKTRVIDFLVALNTAVREAVGYTVRLEAGVQTPEYTLESAIGSCRDSAWLLVALLRELGLAARFVSGYLVQLTSDIKSLDGPSGPDADFTDLHAWTEVYLPGAGWVGMDPTSGLFAGEGHIPLAATPHPVGAAPITGATGPCHATLDFSNTVTRFHEDPRVTLPYTPEQWDRVVELGAAVDERMERNDVRLTMGGEPTFVSIDNQTAPEWNTAADGPHKRLLASRLAERLKEAYAPQGLIQRSQGKWYPGEPLPRWQMEIMWRADGKPIWRNPELLADPWSTPEQCAAAIEIETYGANPDGTVGEDPARAERAQKLLAAFAANLGLPAEQVMPAYEDPLVRMRELATMPPGDPGDDPTLPTARTFTQAEFDVDLETLEDGDEEELAPEKDSVARRRSLLARLDAAVNDPSAHVLPLSRSEDRTAWQSAVWSLRRGRVVLTPGTSPAGLRLPLNSLSWGPAPTMFEADPTAPHEALPADPAEALGHTVRAVDPSEFLPRTALVAEVRDGVSYVFMPPTSTAEEFLALVELVEGAAAATATPVVIEGYGPPSDPRLTSLSVTPDPGVIEVNIQPTASFAEQSELLESLYDHARHVRLGTESFDLDGSHGGTGGGNHITLGGTTPADSPMLRRPDLLASMLTYWQRHPSLSYLFSGRFIGTTSQAPRVDEGRESALYELEIALAEIDRLSATVADPRGTGPKGAHSADDPESNAPNPWVTDRALRHLLTDITGNTHRAEFCIDKLYSPDSVRGRLGLLELRAFEMPPHHRMAMVQSLLVRSLVSWFWEKPYRARLIRHGGDLHGKHLLPHYVIEDIALVAEELREAGYPFETAWLDPFTEFRFPRLGTVQIRDQEVELRGAIEPWNTLGEESTGTGTARYVDSSVERVQVRVLGGEDDRYLLTCNGFPIPLRSTGRTGERVAGIRFRAWQPPSALHPSISIDTPLTFDLVDTVNGRSVGGATYHVVHPGGRAYDRPPVNAVEAESRRNGRFEASGHTTGAVDVGLLRERQARQAIDFGVPGILDLRRARTVLR
ncbi:transglutaminase family protein [Gordonia rubripertincta]|uniref:transglutaminase family protein n=1 Tax=Gordonia rubripertincta TaxID=36822 RepID=UPI00117BE6CE|nr:transglutaminase family protein [Gordonia rubripertincta]TSD98917.1 transglutaminase family protein [Gordonia rubripertincta]